MTVAIFPTGTSARNAAVDQRPTAGSDVREVRIHAANTPDDRVGWSVCRSEWTSTIDLYPRDGGWWGFCSD